MDRLLSDAEINATCGSVNMKLIYVNDDTLFNSEHDIVEGLDIMPYLDEIEKAYATYKASCLQNVIDEYVREYKPAPFQEIVIACIQEKQAGF